MIPGLLERFAAGDRRALSRLLTLVARGEAVETIRAGLPPVSQSARVIALTGAGGVGKSTLTGKLLEPIRAAGLRVAVLACDPQSPLSGGALLGDRFRMPPRAEDEGVFIRSLAAAGGQGALANHVDTLIAVVEAFGFEVILVETVGAGQGDTAVRALVDVLVLLLQPETGDDLQWEKAGLLEVADLVAIHKADLPGAQRVEAQVLASLSLSATTAPPVVRVSSREGSGVNELWQAIEHLPGRRALRREPLRILRLAQDLLADRFTHEHVLMQKWQRGEITDLAAARQLLGDPPSRPG
jgi:LAO/AO transport system ATPase